MLEKWIKENQAAVSVLTKQWSILQKKKQKNTQNNLPNFPVTSNSQQSHTHTHTHLHIQQLDTVLHQAEPLPQGAGKEKAEVTAPGKCPRRISQDGAPAAPGSRCCRDHETRALQARVTRHLKHFPRMPDNRCLGPWHSSRKALETNTNYPCRCTWRIQAHFAAGAAHFPASVSSSPRPLHWPGSAQVATPPTRPCLHSEPYREAGHGPGLPYFAPCRLLSASAASPHRSWCCLQPVPLAQAAGDHLKPQPFICEKREPGIRLIDRRLLKYRLGQGKEKLTFSAWMMEWFLDSWAFLVPSLIEVIRWSHSLTEKGNLVSNTCTRNELMNWVKNHERVRVVT